MPRPVPSLPSSSFHPEHAPGLSHSSGSLPHLVCLVLGILGLQSEKPSVSTTFTFITAPSKIPGLGHSERFPADSSRSHSTGRHRFPEPWQVRCPATALMLEVVTETPWASALLWLPAEHGAHLSSSMTYLTEGHRSSVQQEKATQPGQQGPSC